jgi:hypothetical protein
MSRTPSQSTDPNLWPATRRHDLVQELVEGRDTLAGLALRHGLPVQTLLELRSQGLRERGVPRQSTRWDSLLMRGVGTAQSRLTGAC